MNKRRLTKQEKAKLIKSVVKRYDNGESVFDISFEIGYHKTTVHSWIRDYKKRQEMKEQERLSKKMNKVSIKNKPSIKSKKRKNKKSDALDDINQIITKSCQQLD